MFRRKSKNKTLDVFPNNLHDTGYMIDANGQLCYLSGKPYNFHDGIRRQSIQLYDHLVDLLTEHVGKLLINEHGLEETYLPIGNTKDDIHTKIYLSPDVFENEKMMVFVPCTGYPVGVWSRRVMVDHSVPDGSMLKYTERARQLGFSLIITNPNEVYWCNGKAVLALPKPSVGYKKIPGLIKSISTNFLTRYILILLKCDTENDTPEAHINYVFKNFIIPSGAKKIFIIADTYGGHCVVNAMEKYFEKLRYRVRRIDFVTSTHSIDNLKSNGVKLWIQQRCRNWINSDKEFGQEINDPKLGCISYSSGSKFQEFIIRDIIEITFKSLICQLNYKETWDTDGESDTEDENWDLSEVEVARVMANTKIIDMSEGIELTV
ncbi:hypothetical protein G9A89_017978 [Geosiphon pyriformis]|nr:hypothetical protein G9A89_017978 [Geosiphon pyriformis]